MKTFASTGDTYSLIQAQDIGGNSNNALVLQPYGDNVGIGTTTPAQKLHVSGNARVTGAYYDSNNSPGTSGQVLSSTATGTDWVSLSEISGVDGTGTANYVAKWSDTDTITDSVIYDTGTNVGIGTTVPDAKLQVVRSAALPNGTNSDSGNWIESAAFRITSGNNGLSVGVDNVSNSRTSWIQSGHRDTQYASSLSDSELLLQPLGGNVGIGTASPNQKLHISGNVRIDDGYTLSWGADTTKIAGNSSNNTLSLKTSSTDRLYINSSGNIGIGTTSPEELLHIKNGDVGVTPYDLGTGLNIEGTTSNVGINIISSNTGQGRIYFASPSSNTAGAIEYNHDATLSNGFMKFRTGNSERMRIDGSGNVGIGTTNPQAQLQIDTPETNGAGQGLRINRPSAGTHYHSVEFATNGTVDWSVGQNSNDAFEIYEDGVAVLTRFTIKEGGNVGIGTTSPQSRLEVVSTIPSSIPALGLDSNLFQVGGGTYGTMFGSISNGNGYIQQQRFDGTATAYSLLLQPNGGNVGIGTPSPQFKLDIDGGAAVPLRLNSTADYQLKLTSSDSWTGIEFDDGAASAADHIWHNGQNQTFAFGGGGSNVSGKKLHVHGATTIGSGLASTAAPTNGLLVEGNVGIGTTSPGFKLSVAMDGDTYSADFYQSNSGTDKYNAIRVRGAMTSAVGYYGIGGSTAGNPAFRDAFVVGTQSAHSFNLATNDTARMTITSSGNVGIGETNPGAKLEVNGNIKLSSTVGSTATPSNIWLGNDYSNGQTRDKLKIYLYNSGTEQYGFSVGNQGDVQYHSNQTHDFYVDNSFKVRIDSSGNVGIGTTSPGAKLTVAGSAISISNGWTGNHDILFVGGSASSTGSANQTAARIRSTASVPGGLAVGDLLFTVNSGDAFVDALYIKEDGNVGIGTTSPDQLLVVADSSTNAERGIIIRNSHGDTSADASLRIDGYAGSFIDFYRNSGLRWKFNRVAFSDDFKISAAGAGGAGDVMYFDYNTGNVGIGTTTPSSKLQVAGGVQMADDTDTASASKVGTLRYRADANNSYVDMCMQTGASTYEWINIVQNNW